MLSDRKIKLVSVDTGLPKPLIIGMWVSLLILAGESPDRGKILSARGKPMPFPFLCDEIGVDESTCRLVIDAFVEMNMIYQDDEGAFIITKWDNRQFKSDDAYARVKKHRQEKMSKSSEQGEIPSSNSNEEKGGIESDEYTKRFNDVSRNGNETFQETPQSQSQSQSQNLLKEEELTPKTRHPDYGKVCEVYQYEIGGLSQTVSDTLDDDIKTYSAAWLIDAMKLAAKANIRRLDYVEGILKNWLAIGGPQNDKPKGSKQNGGKPNGSNQRSNGPLQRTGEALEGEPTFDPSTKELVFPDGRRVPAVS